MIEELKKEEYLNTIPRFNRFKENPEFLSATNSFSFVVDCNEKMVKNETKNVGCHSFVKSRVYGKDYSLCVVIKIEYVFYTEDEIRKYINLLKEIGFQIDFKGILNNNEIKEKHQLNDLEANKTENYVFMLGENYTNNPSACRYVALCLLRNLWSLNQFFIPYRFLEFYKYFKKRKVKPSLSKILVFACLCPHNLLNDDYLSKRLIGGYKYEEIKDEINKEAGLFGAYYGLIGYNQGDIIINTDNKQLYKSFYISLLLIAGNNFNLLNFIENYQNNGKVPAKIDGLFLNLIGKSRIIWDESNILNNKLRDLLKEKQYYKAFLYLKELANCYKEFPDTHFSNFPDIEDNTIYELKKTKGTEFIKKFLKNKLKNNGKK